MKKQELILRHNEILAQQKRDKIEKYSYTIIVGSAILYFSIHIIIYLTWKI